MVTCDLQGKRLGIRPGAGVFESGNAAWQKERAYNGSTSVPSRDLNDGFAQGGPEEVIEVVNASSNAGF